MNTFDEKGQDELPKEPENSIFKEALIFLWEIFKVIVFSLAIILPIRYYLIQPFYVKGASMEPNFHDHEYLIVDQISYRFRSPARGEVIVFRYPREPKDFFIKRVIGLPGETIKVSGGKVIIFNKENPDGKELNESYLTDVSRSVGNVSEVLGEDEFFLLGDNRPESLDSRVFGPVKKKSIIGRVIFRGWPLNKVKVFSQAPVY